MNDEEEADHMDFVRSHNLGEVPLSNLALEILRRAPASAVAFVALKTVTDSENFKAGQPVLYSYMRTCGDSMMVLSMIGEMQILLAANVKVRCGQQPDFTLPPFTPE